MKDDLNFQCKIASISFLMEDDLIILLIEDYLNFILHIKDNFKLFGNRWSLSFLDKNKHNIIVNISTDKNSFNARLIELAG